ncbi:4-(cytidine 5'-diphospho)-2-C-methyl-D-erythritol kinase [Ferrimonas balearica]|uniref:4-(cytidine 5'-diphospho)-2-C-methyl-D-erythritol kinase n=1 Tax=Ferrimonas balearica TaxID=44012 RepID=UPI001C9A28AF|nr:4-(cytidine 5'-diphospho)-2-C-methyl-D-erythritol kinase [Ferrimonas balearica]MBY5921917.1 4-(cytidine 5'-diphospho)-2-C-methyl-D-erythritol kinase [Ferrimonas balearica]MBY5994743.1 4-(cytidine 5'-diphospho)-2-C-methyl-D-erythritol kinase [Ferrimonas balearica]
MSTSAFWPAPAKLNLCLHINGRRPDGYHELQTLFQFLDVGDRLSFEITEDGEIALTPEVAGVAHDDNLIVRAARRLQSHTGTHKGALIHLDKGLPMGGGLGGGSSDAATTLVALNHLWDTKVDEDTLAELGLALGADVPVFVRGRAAMADGVGEKLRPVEVDEPWYLVVVPDVEVSTAAVFGHPHLTRNTPKIAALETQPERWQNDCQSVVCDTYPQVAKALSWLIEYAPSKMTGTGSCVFGRFSDQTQAQAALAQLPAQWRGFVAKGCNLSPLQAKLGQ